MLARVALAVVLCHGGLVLNEHGLDFAQQLERTATGVSPALGLTAAATSVLLLLTALERVRRNMFELFYYSHHLFALVWLAAFLHVQWSLHRLVLGLPAALYAGDRLIRLSRRRFKHKIAKATIIDNAIKLDIRAATGALEHFEAGSYCFLNFPELSLLQWHPFSISSAPGAPLTFHIKGMGAGTFTTQLQQHLQLTPQRPINIDGPYGHVALRMYEYSTVSKSPRVHMASRCEG